MPKETNFNGKKTAPTKIMKDPFDESLTSLNDEYAALVALYDLQPPLVQRFLAAQARGLAEELSKNHSNTRFSFPNQIVVSATAGKPLTVPPEQRDQSVGSVINHFIRPDARTVIRERLIELEESENAAVSASAKLIRFSTAHTIVHELLPSGRSVQYSTGEGEEIPSIPVAVSPDAAPSAILAPTDAVAEESEDGSNRGTLQVPFVAAAQRFFMPQWVAFDDECHLLVNSVSQAEACIASMQQFLFLLHTAVSIAPYVVADKDYQQKRYGILGQLVNQGRMLARYQTDKIIEEIVQRASANDLNRGLSLSLPYFDDQGLEMRLHDFEVIPAGRIMFVPAFVVRGARQEQAKVAQDTRLGHSSRKYLLAELKHLETAFINR